MKKTTKRYIITTGALNCYGYRILSSGVDFTQYNNNPVLLWMHGRAVGGDKNQILPLGRVTDIRLEGDAWTGQPEFDENDDFAMSVFQKYENGTLNMLSLGAKPLAYSSEQKDLLPGQTEPTVTSCKVQDISCVDIGGNDEAFGVQLYGGFVSRIALSAISIKTSLKHEASTMAVVTNALNAGKIDSGFASALLNSGNDEKAINLIFTAVKNSKINSEKITGGIPKHLLPQLSLSYDDIRKTIPGGFLELRQEAPEVYKAKFFEKFGRLPFEQAGQMPGHNW